MWHPYGVYIVYIYIYPIMMSHILDPKWCHTGIYCIITYIPHNLYIMLLNNMILWYCSDIKFFIYTNTGEVYSFQETAIFCLCKLEKAFDPVPRVVLFGPWGHSESKNSSPHYPVPKPRTYWGEQRWRKTYLQAVENQGPLPLEWP